VRAVLAGCLIGGVLSLSNIYAGLKIGWGFNMSITAMLLAFAFFRLTSKRPFGMLENNINQTGASAAASISSAGLVAPIPAYTILTGKTLSYFELVVWTAAVSLVGVVVAIGLRKQMIVVDKLPFPGGVASAETIKQIYAHGKEAMARVRCARLRRARRRRREARAHFAKLHPLGPARRDRREDGRRPARRATPSRTSASRSTPRCSCSASAASSGCARASRSRSAPSAPGRSSRRSRSTLAGRSPASSTRAPRGSAPSTSGCSGRASR
jgi:hypothetical protein